MFQRLELIQQLEEFKKNLDTNQELVLMDKDGNILPQETKLATGMKLKVGTDKVYKISVMGDTNGDGEVSAIDFAKVQLHILKYEELKDEYLKAADIDENNEISANDMAGIKLIIIGLYYKEGE